MQQDVAVATVSHAHQLSVAPVFLPSAVGAMLGVLTSRVALLCFLREVSIATATLRIGPR